MNVDELADEIVKLIGNSNRLDEILNKIENQDQAEKRNSLEISGIKDKYANIEARFNKLAQELRKDMNDLEMEQVKKNEKVLFVLDDMDIQLSKLRAQIDDLRSGMIRISNALKEFKETS